MHIIFNKNRQCAGGGTQALIIKVKNMICRQSKILPPGYLTTIFSAVYRQVFQLALEA
jgi:hypothetical protein